MGQCITWEYCEFSFSFLSFFFLVGFFTLFRIMICHFFSSIFTSESILSLFFLFSMFTIINQYQEPLKMLILDYALFPLQCRHRWQERVLWKFLSCLTQRRKHTIYPLAVGYVNGLYLRVMVSQFSFFIFFFAIWCNHRSNAFHLFGKINTNTLF